MRQRVVDICLDLLLLRVRHQCVGARSDSRADRGARKQGGREDQSDDGASNRAPNSALGGLVEVVVNLDLPVGAAADEVEPVDLDRVLLGEVLDAVPIAFRGVRVVIGRDDALRGSGGSTVRLRALPPLSTGAG